MKGGEEKKGKKNNNKKSRTKAQKINRSIKC